MRLKLSPTRQPVAAARKRAYALYFDGAKRAYDAAWGVVLAHLPATAKCLHSPLAPFVAVYLDAHAAQRRYGIYGYELKCAETLMAKAGAGAGGLSDPVILQQIRQAIEDGLSVAAFSAAGAVADGEQAWFASEGIHYAPADADALFARYKAAFEAAKDAKGMPIGGFRGVADTATDDVLHAVHDYYQNPTGVAQLTDNLRGYFSPYRAETAARTETTRLSSVSTTGIMNDFGETQWEWVANGNSPCSVCAALNGQVFTLGDGQEMPPDGSHPNDECTAAASIDTAAAATDAPDAGAPDVTAPDASQGDVPSDTDGSPFTVQDDGLDLTETAPDVEP